MATSVFVKSFLLSIFVVLIPSSTEKHIPPTAKTTNSIKIGICQQPVAQSDFCQGFFPRWYFNHKTKKCQHYIYGGCGASDNMFLSVKSCQLACGVGKDLGLKDIPTTQPTLKQKLTTTQLTPKSKTTLPTPKQKTEESRPKVDQNVTKKKSLKSATTTQPLLTTTWSPPTASQPPPTALQIKKPCEEDKMKSLNLNQSGVFVPECNHKGYYKAKQCWKPLGLPHYCWCVDKYGSKTGEVRITQSGKKTCKKASGKSSCIIALRQALNATLILVHGMHAPIDVLAHIKFPKCDLSTRLYLPKQCHLKKCWCVDVYNGKMIKNTSGIKGFVKCD